MLKERHESKNSPLTMARVPKSGKGACEWREGGPDTGAEQRAREVSDSEEEKLLRRQKQGAPGRREACTQAGHCFAYAKALRQEGNWEPGAPRARKNMIK